MEKIASVSADDPALHPQTYDAATLLVEHLFTPNQKPHDRIEYAVEYRLAHGEAGGNVIDVYGFDNGSVAFSVSDISGKGPRAAVHAALIKFALRAYASDGATPESTLQSLNRLYVENSKHEGVSSFATVFYGHVDAERRVMGYACAAHESVLLARPGEPAAMLAITAPLIGLFETSNRDFNQHYEEIRPGTVLLAVTDGITDARRGDIEFFGLERVRETLEQMRDEPMKQLAERIIQEAADFWDPDRVRDDMAVLAVRFL